MRSVVSAGLILTMSSLAVHAQPTGVAPAPAQADLPLRARLTDDAIRQAVKQTLADDDRHTVLDQGKALSGDRYEKFARAVDEAKIPDCLHADALKYQPTYVFVGLLAIPFWALAAIRGKCR